MRGATRIVLFLNDAGAGTLANMQARHTIPTAAVAVTDNSAVLAPPWLAAFGMHDIVTPATLLRDVQERQTAAERYGLRLWCLTEGDSLHLIWPGRGMPPDTPFVIHCPSRPAVPTTF